MTKYVLIVWIMSLNPDGGTPTYVTEGRELGSYFQLDRCETERDKLMEMTKVEKGAVTITCDPRHD